MFNFKKKCSGISKRHSEKKYFEHQKSIGAIRYNGTILYNDMQRLATPVPLLTIQRFLWWCWWLSEWDFSYRLGPGTSQLKLQTTNLCSRNATVLFSTSVPPLYTRSYHTNRLISSGTEIVKHIRADELTE